MCGEYFADHPRTAADFSDQDVAGLSQVYVALSNLYTFIAQYLEDLQDMCSSLDRVAGPISQKFKSKSMWVILY